MVTPTAVRAAPGRGAVVARLDHRLAIGDHPTELLIVGVRRGPAGDRWLKVRLDRRPNTAAGWIAADAVRVRHARVWIDIRLRQRTMTIYRGGREWLRVPVVVGAPATPTPTGLFAVQLVAPQRDPDGFLGPWAFHLTAHSRVLDDYGGGPGRVAIHGRGGAALVDPLGAARSHGCIRVDNRAIRRMARVVRPGTPVYVRRA